MIITKEKKSVVQSHDFDQVNCTIDAEDMRYVASLLRNNYSDSIVAIIREISANALDANMEANSTRKIEVHVPTAMSPSFTVRDFGDGIGKFAPLSYGNSFTVVSRNGGLKTSYNIYVDENDDTKIVKLDSQLSDSAQGLEVQVAVSEDDLNRFTEKIKSFFKYFGEEEMPNFFGLPDGVEQPQKVLEGEGWFLEETENNYYRYGSESHAFMGRVHYPISTSSMNLDNEEDGSKIDNILSQDNLHIEFEIGSLKLHHSRESLEYNKQTQETLIARAREVLAEIEIIAQEKLGGANDLWDAKLKYAQIVNSLPSNIKSLLQNAFTWNGIKISSPAFNCNFNHNDEYHQARVFSYEKEATDDVSDGFRVVNRKQDKVFCKENSIIAIADCPSHGLSLRARTLFKEDENLELVQVLSFEDKVVEDAFNQHHSFDKVSEEHIVNFSTIDKATLASRASIKHGRGAVPLKELNIDTWKDGIRANWDSSDSNVEDLTYNATECVYFPTLSNHIVSEDVDASNEEIVSFSVVKQVLKTIRQRFKDEDKEFPIVYGIQVKKCKRLEKSVWKNGIDWILNQISDVMTEEVLLAYGHNHVIGNGHDSNLYSELVDVIGKEELSPLAKKEFGKEHPLVKLNKMVTTEFSENAKIIREISDLISFYNKFGENVIKPTFSKKDFNRLLRDLDRAYPVLKHIYVNWHSLNETLPVVIDYVKTMDSVNKSPVEEKNS